MMALLDTLVLRLGSLVGSAPVVAAPGFGAALDAATAEPARLAEPAGEEEETAAPVGAPALPAVTMASEAARVQPEARLDASANLQTDRRGTARRAPTGDQETTGDPQPPAASDRLAGAVRQPGGAAVGASGETAGAADAPRVPSAPSATPPATSPLPRGEGQGEGSDGSRPSPPSAPNPSQVGAPPANMRSNAAPALATLGPRVRGTRVFEDGAANDVLGVAKPVPDLAADAPPQPASHSGAAPTAPPTAEAPSAPLAEAPDEQARTARPTPTDPAEPSAGRAGTAETGDAPDPQGQHRRSSQQDRPPRATPPTADAAPSLKTPSPTSAATVAAAAPLVAETDTPAPDDDAPISLDGAPTSTASDAPATTASRPTRAALPARLAAPAWLSRLTPEAAQVRVALGEDGAVRLHTRPDGDGVAVTVQFSDPEMQALAAAHAPRLREVLAAHFGADVTLSLGDADVGQGERGSARDPAPSTPTASATGRPSLDSATIRPRRALGAGREWIG